MAGLDEDRKRASAWELVVVRILTALAYLIEIMAAFLIVLVLAYAIFEMQHHHLLWRYRPDP